MIRLAAVLALVATIGAGCASARYGIGDSVTTEKVIHLHPGKTNRQEVLTIFGKPDIIKKLEEGSVEEFTYLQGKNESVSWMILSGYLLYQPVRGASGTRMLIVRFKEGILDRFLATDGKLTLKEGYGEEKEKKERGGSPQDQKKGKEGRK